MTYLPTFNLSIDKYCTSSTIPPVKNTHALSIYITFTEKTPLKYNLKKLSFLTTTHAYCNLKQK